MGGGYKGRGGRSPSEDGGPLSKEWTSMVTNTINGFKFSQNDTLELEPMDRHQRKFVHTLAAKLRLISKSSGEGSNRRCVLSRRPPTSITAAANCNDSEPVSLTPEQKVAISAYIAAFPIQDEEIDTHITVSNEAGDRVREASKKYAGPKAVPQVPPTVQPYPDVQRTRQELPAYRARQDVIRTIENNKVSLITGGTGCGKTTQVPQFLLERALETNTPIRIVVTQPRRLPAIAVAERVARERAEKLGATVGYHIRLEQKTSNLTVLTYCTSGVLLRMLTQDELASDCTHIILDEVHEREQNTDYLLIALKQALKKRHDLKVILMSATMEGNLKMFMDYFRDFNIAHLNIPSRLYPVEKFHLADVIALTGYTPPESPYGGTFGSSFATGSFGGGFSGGTSTNGGFGGGFRIDNWQKQPDAFASASTWNNNDALTAPPTAKQPLTHASSINSQQQQSTTGASVTDEAGSATAAIAASGSVRTVHSAANLPSYNGSTGGTSTATGATPPLDNSAFMNIAQKLASVNSCAVMTTSSSQQQSSSSSQHQPMHRSASTASQFAAGTGFGQQAQQSSSSSYQMGGTQQGMNVSMQQQQQYHPQQQSQAYYQQQQMSWPEWDGQTTPNVIDLPMDDEDRSMTMQANQHMSSSGYCMQQGTAYGQTQSPGYQQRPGFPNGNQQYLQQYYQNCQQQQQYQWPTYQSQPNMQLHQSQPPQTACQQQQWSHQQSQQQPMFYVPGDAMGGTPNDQYNAYGRQGGMISNAQPQPPQGHNTAQASSSFMHRSTSAAASLNDADHYGAACEKYENECVAEEEEESGDIVYYDEVDVVRSLECFDGDDCLGLNPTTTTNRCEVRDYEECEYGDKLWIFDHGDVIDEVVPVEEYTVDEHEDDVIYGPEVIEQLLPEENQQGQLWITIEPPSPNEKTCEEDYEAGEDCETAVEAEDTVVPTPTPQESIDEWATITADTWRTAREEKTYDKYARNYEQIKMRIREEESAASAMRSCMANALGGVRPPVFNDDAIQMVKAASYDRNMLANMYRSCGGAQWAESVDIDLALAMVRYLMDSPIGGSILIFLPGYEDIQALRDKIIIERWPCTRPSLCLLHSQLNTTDQQRVFDKERPGERKVILSTNIAEASLTIDDVVFVIDCGKAKEKTYDHLSRISQLKVVWIAKSNAEQRSGRAGRCRPGFCFRLYSNAEYDSMLTSQIAEMQRSAIHDVCLHAKMFAPEKMSVREFLEMAPEPPAMDAIESSLQFLEQLGALYTEKGSFIDSASYFSRKPKREPELTQLGRLIAHLPLDPQLARLLLFGYTLRCFSPIVTLVALLSHRDPFTLAMGEEKQAALSSRDSFAHRDFSDHLMMLRAFNAYCEIPAYQHQRLIEFCRNKYISFPTMKMVAGIRRQLLMELRRIRFINNVDTVLDDPFLNQYSNKWPIIQAAIVAGSYPCIGFVKGSKMRKIRTSTDSTAQLHPSSSLRRQTQPQERRNPDAQKYYSAEPTIEYLAFQEFVKIDEGLTLRTSTAIPSTTIVLFAGPIRLSKDKLQAYSISGDETALDDCGDQQSPFYQPREILELESWLSVKGEFHDFVRLMQLRFKIMEYFLAVCRVPSEINLEKNKKLLETLCEVLSCEHRSKGFNEVTDICAKVVPKSDSYDFGPMSTPSSSTTTTQIERGGDQRSSGVRGSDDRQMQQNGRMDIGQYQSSSSSRPQNNQYSAEGYGNNRVRMERPSNDVRGGQNGGGNNWRAQPSKHQQSPPSPPPPQRQMKQYPDPYRQNNSNQDSSSSRRNNGDYGSKQQYRNDQYDDRRREYSNGYDRRDDYGRSENDQRDQRDRYDDDRNWRRDTNQSSSRYNDKRGSHSSDDYNNGGSRGGRMNSRQQNDYRYKEYDEDYEDNGVPEDPKVTDHHHHHHHQQQQQRNSRQYGSQTRYDRQRYTNSRTNNDSMRADPPKQRKDPPPEEEEEDWGKDANSPHFFSTEGGNVKPSTQKKPSSQRVFVNSKFQFGGMHSDRMERSSYKNGSGSHDDSDGYKSRRDQ